METGLHYNGARYYDPNTGRYVQSDPIGLNGGISTYAYVGNNPLDYIDVFGTQRGPIEMGGSALDEKLQDTPDTDFGLWPANWYKKKNQICVEERCTTRDCKGNTYVHINRSWVPDYPTVGEVHDNDKGCVCVVYQAPPSD